ncbi:MAG: hypothetical protein RBR42_13545, partial [Desulfomicrobium sp.]|nr:hypothetical protein [Desulfomicrobium sp.]
IKRKFDFIKQCRLFLNLIDNQSANFIGPSERADVAKLLSIFDSVKVIARQCTVLLLYQSCFSVCLAPVMSTSCR